jgi:hypothetical protein
MLFVDNALAQRKKAFKTLTQLPLLLLQCRQLIAYTHQILTAPYVVLVGALLGFVCYHNLTEDVKHTSHGHVSPEQVLLPLALLGQLLELGFDYLQVRQCRNGIVQ